MSFVRRIVMSIGLIGLAACATAQGDSQASERVASASETASPLSSDAVSLPPQTLRNGECGLFGYNPDAQFVFFATSNRGAYLSEGQLRALQPDGEFPNLDYASLDLALGRAEALVDGRRYTEARLREVLPDGFTRILPLRVIETCSVPGP